MSQAGVDVMAVRGRLFSSKLKGGLKMGRHWLYQSHPRWKDWHFWGSKASSLLSRVSTMPSKS